MNINWYDNQVPYMDTLQFAVSIPQKFRIDDLYEIKEGSQKHAGEGYILQSVVCFLGAHYMTYIKKKQADGLPVWKLYDDYKPV